MWHFCFLIKPDTHHFLWKCLKGRGVHLPRWRLRAQLPQRLLSLLSHMACLFRKTVSDRSSTYTQTVKEFISACAQCLKLDLLLHTSSCWSVDYDFKIKMLFGWDQQEPCLSHFTWCPRYSWRFACSPQCNVLVLLHWAAVVRRSGTHADLLSQHASLMLPRQSPALSSYTQNTQQQPWSHTLKKIMKKAACISFYPLQRSTWKKHLFLQLQL